MSESRTRGPWPAPWKVEDTKLNRARVVDARGAQVVSGMNIYKAETIVAAVNRDSAVPELVHALEMVRDANKSDPHIPSVALATIDAAIAKAKGAANA